MKRVVTAGIGLVAASLVMVGCSSDKEAAPSASPAAQGNPTTQVSVGGNEVSTGGNSSVKVEGKDLDGLDLNSVTCVKSAGKITVASAPIGGGAQGLGVVMTDTDPPKVESLGLVVDGNALAVSEMGGMKTGSAEVAVDGSNYTITGEAAGADMQNPMAGMITKKFEIKVTCN